jgi:CRISPR-associated protein Csd1
MILQALNQLAQREKLVSDPDFEWKPVAWLVRVGKDGNFLGIQGTHYEVPAEGTKKPRIAVGRFSLPREGGRTSGDRAFFLHDKAEYAFGLDPDVKRPKEKLQLRFALFRERVIECLEATNDEGVKAVDTLLGEVFSGHVSIPLPEKCATNDLFAFVYGPDVDLLLTERDKVKAYWKKLRQQVPSSKEAQRQCLVSGILCEPTDLFPLLKRVPGGSTSGVGLVSFNSNAFESYGWKSNSNAPVSRNMAEACSTALNRLLDSSFPDPNQLGQTLPRRNLLLSADTVVCYWSSNEAEEDAASQFGPLLNANPDEVKEVYRSIWRGVKPTIKDPSAFYALTLTGIQGRAIIRGWFESTVETVLASLAQHFEDLQIVHGPKEKDSLSLFRLLASTAVQGKSENIPPNLAGETMRSILEGLPYPQTLLQAVVRRIRAEHDITFARAALLKACINRTTRSHNPQIKEELNVSLDTGNTNIGYRLGRLFAALEKIQSEASPGINATIRDRFYGAASGTPVTVFSNLMRLKNHHLAKLDSKGRQIYFEKLIAEIMDTVKDFPSHLPLADQGRFAIGYYHQTQQFYTKKENAPSDSHTSNEGEVDHD